MCDCFVLSPFISLVNDKYSPLLQWYWIRKFFLCTFSQLVVFSQQQIFVFPSLSYFIFFYFFQCLKLIEWHSPRCLLDIDNSYYITTFPILILIHKTCLLCLIMSLLLVIVQFSNLQLLLHNILAISAASPKQQQSTGHWGLQTWANDLRRQRNEGKNLWRKM